MTADTDARRELGSSVALAALFAMIALLVGADLALDVRGGTTAVHASIEGAVVAIGLVAATRYAIRVRGLAREARDLRRRARALGAQLDASLAEAARWRRDAGDLISGLGAAIDAQLEQWGVTPAEQEVALLLLKGLSHKEIAEIRGVSETTVRHQARALYRKAGLGGRNDLAAFFLEDLLGPRHTSSLSGRGRSA
ncbi:MAG TPA: helix-turn-helix transcriptional regulator [Kofleriaceae bacterium]|nr:helix-turn-helix transcriptional regulator [Kofleriaceae bacterium]